MRYFFDQDEDSHWYMIPLDQDGHWDYTRSIHNEDRRNELINQDFGKYRISGGPSFISFEKPEERDD